MKIFEDFMWEECVKLLLKSGAGGVCEVPSVFNFAFYEKKNARSKRFLQKNLRSEKKGGFCNTD